MRITDIYISIGLAAVVGLCTTTHLLGQKPDAEYLKSLSIRTAKDLPAFVKQIKTITLLNDTGDDVIAKIGKPSSQNVLFGKKVWRYDFVGEGMQSVVCVLEFNTNEKIGHVYVTKAGPAGVEQIYSQGTSQLNAAPETQISPENQKNNSVRLPVSAVAPDSPQEGEVYFNSSDKCFYGWNGNKWVVLGEKP